MLNSTTVEHREWYWAFQIHDEPLQQWVPVKFLLKMYNSSGSLVISSESSKLHLLMSCKQAEIMLRFLRFSSQSIHHLWNRLHDGRLLSSHGSGRSVTIWNTLTCRSWTFRLFLENFTLGVISFTINNDGEYPVQRNVDSLRFMIWQTLAGVLGVRSVRISNIIVNHDGKDLPVTFTLLDAPPRLGPVAAPLQELSLTAAITKLRTVIDSNMLTFQAKFNTTEVTLTARNSSLQIIYTSTDQSPNQCSNQTSTTTPSTATPSTTILSNATLSTIIPPNATLSTTILSNATLFTTIPSNATLFTTTPSVTECPSTITAPRTTVKQIIEITYKSSGPMITGLWIGFIILGLLVGMVGGFFVSKHFIPQSQ